MAHAAILVDCGAPIIGTLSSPIQLLMKQGRSMVLNRHETDQMQSRVTYLNFSYSLIERDRSHAIECKACVRCAARLCLEGSDDASVAQASTAAMRDRSHSRSKCTYTSTVNLQTPPVKKKSTLCHVDRHAIFCNTCESLGESR